MNYLLSKGIRTMPKIPDKSHLKNIFNLKITSLKQQLN